MSVAIQTAGRRFNHAVAHRLPVYLDRFLCPDYVINPMKSGITHGDAESFGNVKKLPVLASLVADVDPYAGPLV
jgi:hypothetical protein